MDDIREILQKAIERETIAYQEYLEAAQKSIDPEAKSLLEQLARDEIRHRQVLETQLALLMEAEGIALRNGKKEPSRDLDAETCELELEGATRATEVLAEAKREIEKAQKAREELYAMVAHDLRSPLISMGAFAKKLLTALQGKIPEKDHQKLQWVWSEARRLEGFVSNFLDLARLTSGVATLKR